MPNSAKQEPSKKPLRGQVAHHVERIPLQAADLVQSLAPQAPPSFATAEAGAAFGGVDPKGSIAPQHQARQPALAGAERGAAASLSRTDLPPKHGAQEGKATSSLERALWGGGSKNAG